MKTWQIWAIYLVAAGILYYFAYRLYKYSQCQIQQKGIVSETCDCSFWKGPINCKTV